MAFDLKQTLTGAWLRTVAGIKDVGEVIAGYVEDIDGGDVYQIADDKSDVWIKVRDALEPGRTFLARLFAPGNGWWRLPVKGDAVTVLRPGDIDGPGAPVALHGDGGAANAVPSWLDSSNAGLSIPETFHLESTSGDVKVSASGEVDVDAGSGKTVNVNGSDHPLPKFDTFESDLSSFLTTLLSVLQAGTQGSPAAQQLTALSGSLATLNQFISKLGSGTYNSTKAKNG